MKRREVEKKPTLRRDTQGPTTSFEFINKFSETNEKHPKI